MNATVEVAGPRRRSRTKPLEQRLTELYAAHARAAVRLAYLLTGDGEAAEDICQEAFARVGGRLGGLRDPARASGYLFRTVVNLSHGHGRRLQRDRGLKEKLGDPGSAPAADVGLRDEMARALMQLPARQRAAVFFRYYEDLSENQTAEILDCSVAALRSLTFRAMESLRAHVQEVDR